MTTQLLIEKSRRSKPYKTNIREYVSKYDKVDTFEGDTTDFDVHAFYDEDLQLFLSPVGNTKVTRQNGPKDLISLG